MPQPELHDVAVGPDARALAASLFSPPLGPAVGVFRITKLLTVGFLPTPIREGYGFNWDSRRERACRALTTLVRRVRRVLPARLREWPSARAA